MKQLRTGAIVAALTLLALLVGSTAANAAKRDFFGVMPQSFLLDEDYERMGEAKVGTLRFEINWSGVDPTAADGDYDFNGLDAVIRRAAEQNIRPLPFIFGTPDWAAELDGANCKQGQCGTFAPRTSAGLAAFRQFAADLTARYGPGGVFWQNNPQIPEKPIRVWQIWNEMNSPSFYDPKPNVKAYAKLLDAAHKGIRSVDSSAEVILGGMFGTPLGGRKPGITSWDFLDKLYDVKGSKKDFEGVAPHPYAAKLTKVNAQIDLMREAMVNGKDANTDLWITELGWASSGPNNPLVRGNKGQADRLEEAYSYFLKKRGKLNVRTVVWYSWRDNPNPDHGLCEWCPGSGLMTKDLTPKLSFDAFTGFTGGS